MWAEYLNGFFWSLGALSAVGAVVLFLFVLAVIVKRCS